MQAFESKNFPHFLKCMRAAAEKSGEIIRANFRKSDVATEKLSHQDIVTQTDLESQRSIHETLLAGMRELGIPEQEVGFVQEESGADSVKTHTFIVDPIDGTTNFAAGIPFSCISIGYAIGTQLKLGLVYEPFSRTMYWGEVGAGAFVSNELRGERRLQLQPKPTKNWIVAAHFNGLDVVQQQFEAYQSIYPHVRGLRNIGSLTLDLCFMADSVLDIAVNQGCYLWDLAAASVILGEAGGKLYDLQGQDLLFDWTNTKRKYYLLACHPSVQDAAQRLLGLAR